MSESTEVTVREPRAELVAGAAVTPIVPRTIEESFRLATAMHASGLAPSTLGSAEKVLVAIMAGAELGIPPFQAVQSFAVINGRPTIWGDGMMAVVRSNGFRVREWLEGEGDEMTAYCEVIRPDTGEIIERPFSVADAKKASLWNKTGPWQSAPKRMLQMRARAFACRDGAADVLRGFQMREEVVDYDEVRAAPAPAGSGLRARLEATTGASTEGFTVENGKPSVDEVLAGDNFPVTEASPPAGVSPDPSQQVAGTVGTPDASQGAPEPAKEPKKRAAKAKATEPAYPDVPAGPVATLEPGTIRDAEFEDEKGAAEAEAEARPTAPAPDAASPTPPSEAASPASEPGTATEAGSEDTGDATGAEDYDDDADAEGLQGASERQDALDAEVEDEETTAPPNVRYRIFGEVIEGGVRLYENGVHVHSTVPRVAEQFPGFDKHAPKVEVASEPVGESPASSAASPGPDAFAEYADKVAGATSWLTIKQAWRTLNRAVPPKDATVEQWRTARLLGWGRHIALWNSGQDRPDFTDDMILFRFWLDTDAARDVDAINGNFSLLVRSDEYRKSPEDAKAALGRLVVEAKKAAGNG